ncbi:unnamed protein product, partial [Prorocentrum cordatum]
FRTHCAALGGQRAMTPPTVTPSSRIPLGIRRSRASPRHAGGPPSASRTARSSGRHPGTACSSRPAAPASSSTPPERHPSTSSGSCAGTCSSARARRVCRRTAQAGTGTAASPSAGAGPSRASPSGRRSREGRLARRRQFQHIHSQSSWGGGTAPRGRTPGRRRARARGWATAPPGPRRRRPRGASAPCSEQELLPVREALRLPEREPADGSPATSSACSSGHSRASSQGLPASWPPPPPGERTATHGTRADPRSAARPAWSEEEEEEEEEEE